MISALQTIGITIFFILFAILSILGIVAFVGGIVWGLHAIYKTPRCFTYQLKMVWKRFLVGYVLMVLLTIATTDATYELYIPFYAIMFSWFFILSLPDARYDITTPS